MPDQDATVIIATSVVTFVSGFALGIYSLRGYLFISPELAEERRRNFADPVESDESDVDDDDLPLDHAPNWSNRREADVRQGLVQAEKTSAKKASAAVGKGSEDAPPQVVDNGEECKLVLVVRTDLGMTKGKIAAQCSHATLACYKSLSKAAKKQGPQSPAAKLLARWEKFGQAKIALQIKSQDDIMELMGVARSLGVTAEVVADAGRTQIEPGSLTVLGVGPAPRSAVDQVTGHLKLL